MDLKQIDTLTLVSAPSYIVHFHSMEAASVVAQDLNATSKYIAKTCVIAGMSTVHFVKLTGFSTPLRDGISVVTHWTNEEGEYSSDEGQQCEGCSGCSGSDHDDD